MSLLVIRETVLLGAAMNTMLVVVMSLLSLLNVWFLVNVVVLRVSDVECEKKLVRLIFLLFVRKWVSE